MEELELQQQMVEAPFGDKQVAVPGMSVLTRQAAAEGCVLLRNDGVLPLKKEQKVSVFGRCQIDTFLVGYGSGGDVHPPYQISILEGLKACEGITLNETLAKVYEDWCAEHAPKQQPWGKWPMSHPEMPVTAELVSEAAKESGTALIVLGRAAGEDRENVLEQGSYYLTEQEEQLLSLVTAQFAKTVVIMDCGNVIDMAWTTKYPISAILCPWLGGMDCGNAIADVLCGKVNPSGRLSDTIAMSYEDYPSAANFGGQDYNNYEEDIYVGYRYFETFAKDKVLFPFGFGLSYTNFETVCEEWKAEENGISATVRVTNVGNLAGKEVVQLYAEAPQGRLGKAAASLVAFAKTDCLAPGESQVLALHSTYYDFASYDDMGKTGTASAYVLEEGNYRFFLGVDEHGVKKECCGSFCLEQTHVIEQLEPVCPVKDSFVRILPKGEKKADGTYEKGSETVSEGEAVLRQRILDRLPEEIPYTGDKGRRFDEVLSGTLSMEDFIAQLNNEELAALANGGGAMNSPLGTEGNAGIFGGITEGLRKKGIPPLVTADGPAGLRIKRYTTLLPCGVALACTWNTELIEKLFEKLGEEMIHFEVDVVLSPGMNIHRNPLCGRNFEYYSEDPLLSGRMAAAAVRGIQKQKVSACPKHFAANNQEVRRNRNDSRMSERALREIYLKGFEYCVKESRPRNLMTSYNKINGVWSHYNYDLVTTVLRGEWKYEGNIVTDWWMKRSPSPEFPEMKDNAYRVRAQVDVLMPGNENPQSPVKDYENDGTLLETFGKPDGITRGELQRTAKNVLTFAQVIGKGTDGCCQKK